MQRGNLSAARSYAQKIQQDNPNSGLSALLDARILMNSAGSLFPGDNIKKRCVYFLVIQKAQAAANKDPKVAAAAQSMIAACRRSLPSKQDIFMHPELGSGKTFSVPGWGSVVLP